jgi:hypothetical protein
MEHGGSLSCLTILNLFITVFLLQLSREQDKVVHNEKGRQISDEFDRIYAYLQSEESHKLVVGKKTGYFGYLQLQLLTIYFESLSHQRNRQVLRLESSKTTSFAAQGRNVRCRD